MTTLLFYLLSFGPMAYLLNLLPEQSKITEVVARTYRYVYKPHLMLLRDNKFYYNYYRWWVTLAIPEDMMMTWEQWQNYQNGTAASP